MGKVAMVLCVLAVAGLAAADWNEGDYDKMHYPQLPKMIGGWDVKASYYRFLADDWQCSETGPVTDIHLWVSFMDDAYFNPTMIHTAIWTDDISGPFSKPKDRVWHKDWSSGWTTRLYGTGPQGWYDPQYSIQDPNQGQDPALHPDHWNVYQINMLIDPMEAYVQEVGNVYWLEFSIPTPIEGNIGWKQSGSPQYRDDAVWRITDGAWEPLEDPFTGLSMDLAFVITPEPGTIGLMLLGLAGWFCRRR